MSIQLITEFKVGDEVEIIGMNKESAHFKDEHLLIGRIGIIQSIGMYAPEKGYFTGQIRLYDEINGYHRFYFYGVRLKGKEEGMRRIRRLRRIYEAIEQSLIHWRDNLTRLKLVDEFGFKISVEGTSHHWECISMGMMAVIGSFSGEDCALCKMCNCDKCPLGEIKHCSEEGTVWRECLGAVGNIEIIKSAEAMVETLEKVLVKYNRVCEKERNK